MKKLSVISVIAISLLLMGCSKMPGADQKDAQSDTPTATKTEETELVVPVYAAKVTVGDIYSVIKVDGLVDAQTTTSIVSKTAGELQNFTLKKGDKITKDQIVGQVDPSNPGMKYMPSPVKAPITGTVTSVNVESGAQVSPQVSLAYVRDLTDIDVKAHVIEKYIGRLAVGERVHIVFEAYPDKTYTGHLESLDPTVNSSTRTLGVTIKLDDTENVLTGMFGKVSIITETHENTLLAPATSVFGVDDSFYVYTLDENSIMRKTPVTIGLSNYDQVEILSGVSEGDTIVNFLSSLLGDGVKAAIVANEGDAE